ncbi:SRPBCC family protein [Nocardioides sp.]|uniref:SRPBCC family protein n=1 Tax=Nocardioides sp. TaxID=35761 RepID=UPI003519859B
MGTYVVRRRARIDADPARVLALIEDLRAWREWSPWEGLDADLERSYTEPTRGPGAAYAWSGNRRAGRGSMEITSSDPEHVHLTLTFERPFRSSSEVAFTVQPDGTGADVEWAMTGERSGLWGLLGRLVPMDALLGRDFEKGLRRLAEVAEA